MPDLKTKLKRYEDMLKSESEATEELMERLQSLEHSLFTVKQEKDKLQKVNKQLKESEETLRFRIKETESS